MAIPEGDREYGWKARKREHRNVDRNQWKVAGGHNENWESSWRGAMVIREYSGNLEDVSEESL